MQCNELRTTAASGLTFLLALAACGPMPAEVTIDREHSDSLRGGIRPCNKSTTSGCCGDGVCAAPETCALCTVDCGTCKADLCGDGVCAANEDCELCPLDCGACEVDPCGDGVCAADEGCESCPLDCGVCEVDPCGDGVCAADEGCESCPRDCGVCPADACGDGVCGVDESCATCPADCGSCCSDGTPPVFPRAEGFGTCTPAGRGGQVLRVTTLASSGPGSLREALTTTGPRTVVFEVSGTIALTSPIYITAPFVTIAGQTAPSPGINIRDYGITIRTHDVLIQHLRMRMGDRYTDIVGPFYVQYYPNKNVIYNVVIDHCSISWGRDDCITFHYYMHDLTLSRSIISEGLEYDAGVSRGLLITDRVKNISIIKNLMAHHKKRFPEVNIASELVHVNNLAYNGGKSSGWVTVVENALNNPTGEPLKVTSENNQFINGPNSVFSQSPYYIDSSVSSTSQLRISGAIYDGTNPVITNYKGAGVLTTARPLWHDSIDVLPAAAVYDYVLTNAGARPADRDAVDERIVNEVETRTGSWKSSVAQAGGHPALAENHRAFNPGSNPHGDDNGNGYTNLEELLHQMSAQVGGM